MAINTAISDSALSEPEADQEYDFGTGVRGSQQQKHSLNLAGELYVAAELNRRGIFASVTYGAAKNANVLAFDQQSRSRQTAVIEVKTIASPNTKWLTGLHSISKSSIYPHLFWVLVLLPDLESAETNPRYFVFTSQELVDKMYVEHRLYAKRRYQETQGVPMEDNRGYYSFLLADAEAMQAEGQWSKIIDWFARK